MIGWLAQTVGGIIGDTIELTKMVGQEIAEIPSAIEKGFNEGLIITPGDQVNTEPMEKDIEVLPPKELDIETTKIV